MTTDTLQNTADFLNQAFPEHNDRTRQVQLGVHFEEVNEMFDGITFLDAACQSYKDNITYYLKALADRMKAAEPMPTIIDPNIVLDSLCDQIVTATSVANSHDLNIVGGLAEVNRSNYSKFVDGKPIYNENGKLAKGPDYTAPDLTPYL